MTFGHTLLCLSPLGIDYKIQTHTHKHVFVFGVTDILHRRDKRGQAYVYSHKLSAIKHHNVKNIHGFILTTHAQTDGGGAFFVYIQLYTIGYGEKENIETQRREQEMNEVFS